MKQHILKTLAGYIAAKQHETARAMIAAMLETETGAHWRRDLAKLSDVLKDGQPRFTVFAKGNGKLPFLAFSSLPGEGFCAGAGDCLNWCYSFRAWRYPAAFCRMAQNSVLLQSGRGREALRAELDKFESKGIQDFRLYVDGDFTSVADVVFWMHTLRRRQWLRAYGYSKSWRELLNADADGIEWPANYKLNLSSGSIHSDSIKRAVAALPITRGEFIAVSLGRVVKNSDHGTTAHNKELRAAYGAKAFTCPGKCGECTPKGHACGSSRFNNIPVIIAVH